MDRIVYFADLSIRRGCAFAVLGIGTTMVACSFDPLLMLKVGGIMLTLMDVTLLLLARRAGRGDYRRTELWTLLDRNPGLALPEPRVRQIITNTLRDTYLRYAGWTALASAGVWALFALVWLALRL